MNKTIGTSLLLTLAALFLLTVSAQAGRNNQSSLMKPANSDALVRHLRELGDKASGRLEPGMSYIQVAAFRTVREAHRTYSGLSSCKYMRLLFVDGDGYIRLLLGPYPDAVDYLWKFRKKFGKDVFIVRAGKDERWSGPSDRPYDQAVITELDPGLEYIQVAVFTNEAEARQAYDGHVRMLFERRIYLAGDGLIRLLAGPFVSGGEYLDEIRANLSAEAILLSGTRDFLFPVPREVNLLLNRKMANRIRKESEVRLYQGLTPPDVTGVFASDWIIPGVPASTGYLTNCIVVLSEQTPDGRIKVRFDTTRFPLRTEAAVKAEDGFISGSGDHFTLYLPFIEHAAVSWTHSVIVMSGNRTPDGDLGNFRFTVVLKEKFDPDKEFLPVNSLSDITELDGALKRQTAVQPAAAAPPAGPDAVSSAMPPTSP